MVTLKDVATNPDLVISPPTQQEDCLSSNKLDQEIINEDLLSDGEIEIEELEKRMKRDNKLLMRLKEKLSSKENIDSTKQRQTQEEERRKKMSRAHARIMKHMLQMMKVCKAQGFVYGIIPENEKPLTGASDNLREWWKEKEEIEARKVYPEYSFPPLMSYDSIGIEDCTKYNVVGTEDKLDIDIEEIKEVEFNNSVIQLQELDRIDFVRKRKSTIDLGMVMDQNLIYTCKFIACPYGDLGFGFRDRISRDNHQLSCQFGPGSQFGEPNLFLNGVKHIMFNSVESSLFPPVNTLQSNVLPECFLQAKLNSTSEKFGQPGSNLSEHGVLDDGQNMISRLRSTYKSNTQGNNMIYDLKVQPQGAHNINKLNDMNIQFNDNLHQDYTIATPITNDFILMNNDNNNIMEMYGVDSLDLSHSQYKEDLQGLLGTDTFPKMDDSIMFP
ncbi:hypothetical protein ACFE04_011686 [Oxalis oulophora]